jgi:hypothetical protein
MPRNRHPRSTRKEGSIRNFLSPCCCSFRCYSPRISPACSCCVPTCEESRNRYALVHVRVSPAIIFCLHESAFCFRQKKCTSALNGHTMAAYLRTFAMSLLGVHFLRCLFFFSCTFCLITPPSTLSPSDFIISKFLACFSLRSLSYSVSASIVCTPPRRRIRSNRPATLRHVE